MRTRLILAILFISASLAGAQDKLADTLRQGILEEESNQNLDKAIQIYHSIVAQFDEGRKTAATALFRLAECYRRQGRRDQAINAYQRLAGDFPDQTKLAELSRNQLSKTYGISQNPASGPDQSKIAEAERMYRALLEDEVKLVEEQIVYEEKQIEAGNISPMSERLTKLRRDLLELKRKLVPYDAGIIQVPPASPRP
jgi:tetratricopeptide (TPR) repeat protein